MLRAGIPRTRSARMICNAIPPAITRFSIRPLCLQKAYAIAKIVASPSKPTHRPMASYSQGLGRGTSF